MHGLLIVITCLIGQTPGPAIDAEQFSRLIEGTFSEFRDVSFLFESTMDYVETSRVRGKSADTLRQTDSGVYAFRSDGATLLDTFTAHPNENGLVVHTIHAMLGDKHESVSKPVDQGPIDLKQGVRVEKRVPGALTRSGWPETIVTLYYFQTLGKLDPEGYEFMGWEEVDGRRCLKVQIAFGSPKSVAKTRYWLDLERGGHPLRIEYRVSDQLKFRTDKIVLAQIEYDNGKKKAWFPMKGESNTFIGNEGTVDHPVWHETYSINDGSVRINQGLKDSQFTLDWKGGLPESPALLELRAKIKPAKPFETDHAGVQRRLEARLSEADQQSQRLDASPGAESRINWMILTQIGLGVVGIGLIAAVMLQKRRAG